MRDDSLSRLLQRLKLKVEIFKHAQYCGRWAVDTSGTRMAPFHLIQEGSCWLHTADRDPRLLEPGDLVVLPHDDRHVISNSKTRPEPGLVNTAGDVDRSAADNVMLCGFFEFTGRIAWPILDGLPDAIVLTRGDRDTDQLIDLIFREIDSDDLGSLAALEFLARALFVQVLRSAIREGVSAGLLSALGDPKIGPVLGEIHARPEAAWNLETLAAVAGASRSVFAEQFKALTGNPPMQYLKLWRVQVANDLLLSTDLAVAQIAERVGYASDVAFRKAFSEQMGVTPAAARRGTKPAQGK